MNKSISDLYQLPILAFLMALAGQSHGQAIEEVVVTANKRGAVSLQDTPGTITALTSESLDKAQVQGFEDYIKMVPGLTSASSGPGQSQIVIRGINAERILHNAPQTGALAGLYVDEMPISVTGFNPDLGVVDVERIEVLKGPQGTLYGASSMSGTIRIVTAKPDTEEFAGKVGADVSHTTDGDINHRVKGSLNVPVSDNVAMRFNLYNASKGGFIDNTAPGFEEEDYNSQDTYGGRAQIGYYGDKLDAIASVMYNKLESDGAPDEYVPDATNPLIPAITKELQTHKVIQDFFNQEFLAINLNLDYDFGPVTLTSATSYFEMDIDKSLDDTFRVNTVTPIVTTGSDYQAWDSNESVIQEIRLASNGDTRLEWVLGGYFELNERSFIQTQPTPGTNFFFATVLGGIPPCPTLMSECFGAVTDSVFDGTATIKTDQIAVFGEATYSLTDALRLKLGFRYFELERDAFIFGAGAANGGVSIDQDTVKEDDFIPKVEVSYDISDEHMVYATYSEGFRTGGINSFIPTACDAEAALQGFSPGDPFSSDSLKNYEIGAKTSWMDGRLIANLTVYQNEFNDIQSTINLQTCGFSHRNNSGKVENTGVEGDFTFQASEALQLNFGFSYVDSEVKVPANNEINVATGEPLVNAVGDTPPYVPEFSASGSIDYGIPVGNGYGYIRTGVRHVGSTLNEFSSKRSTLSKLPSYTIVDVTLGYDLNDWEFNVFASNLFNEDVITNIDPDRNQPGQLSRGMPRTVGFGVTRRF